MHRPFRAAAILVCFAVLLSLTGCYAANIDQYFSLPQPAEEYRQLQGLIDREIASGSEYAAPTRGNYRQSVLLTDLNSNGVDEAMAFFRTSEGTLKINIYAVSGSEYRLVRSLEEHGRSIGRVEFADMDHDGSRDLIVAWQIANGMSILSVYSLFNWSGQQLMTTDCTEFITGDLNQDSRDELLVIRAANTDTYLADMYTIGSDGGPQAATAALSAGIRDLERVRTVTIAGSYPALLVESVLSSGDLVTDLLVYREGALVNLTMNRSSGISETRRVNNQVYSQDIDADGASEIPYPQQLYSQGGETQWSIAWYRYDVSGRAAQVMTTYHCVADQWYLVLPDGWDAGFTVRRDDTVPGEHAVYLSRLYNDGSIHDLLAVYAISGENRSDRARLEGRFVLEESAVTVYAAEILDEGVDRADIQNRFHIIYTEWSAGSI